jgi:hypothetical protein
MSDVIIVQPQTTTVVVSEVETAVSITSTENIVVSQPVETNVIVAPVQTYVTIQGTQQTAVFYTHDQSVPSNNWIISHNLNGYPTAVVLDSAGTMCEGQFAYPSANQMVISFSNAFSGIAYII